MILIKPSFEILRFDPDMLTLIERAGRVCYKSEDKSDFTQESADRFVDGLIRRGHESVIEHSSITVRIICDRGVTHELVRHRLASYSQESTRYCNYEGGVTFVIPPWVDIAPGEFWKDDEAFDHRHPNGRWAMAMLYAERNYIELISQGWTPQQARSVLPNSVKTEIVITANAREWRHIFRLRTSKAAHPQMREIMEPLLLEFANRMPVLFG